MSHRNSEVTLLSRLAGKAWLLLLVYCLSEQQTHHASVLARALHPIMCSGRLSICLPVRPIAYSQH